MAAGETSARPQVLSRIRGSASAPSNTAPPRASEPYHKPREINGGQGRNRTADAGLFRAALYQLSYLARWWKKRA